MRIISDSQTKSSAKQNTNTRHHPTSNSSKQPRAITTCSGVCPKVHVTATKAGSLAASSAAVLTAEKQQLM
jgi:hypothetical protein